MEGTGVELFRMLQEGVPTIEEFLEQNMQLSLIHIWSEQSGGAGPYCGKSIRGHCTSVFKYFLSAGSLSEVLAYIASKGRKLFCQLQGVDTGRISEGD